MLRDDLRAHIFSEPPITHTMVRTRSSQRSNSSTTVSDEAVSSRRAVESVTRRRAESKWPKTVGLPPAERRHQRAIASSFVALVSVLHLAAQAMAAPPPDFEWVAQDGGTASFAEQADGVTIDVDGNVITTGGFAGTTTFGGTSTFTAGGEGDMFVAKYRPDGTLVWVRVGVGSAISSGPNQPGAPFGKDVVVDSDNNIIVAGQYSNIVTFDTITLPVGGANEEAFVVKYDENGSVLWARAFTGPFQVGANGVSTDAATTSM